jgi:hypothetical protein
MTGENYESIYIDSDLSDFPVDHWGSWQENFSDRREDMYGDEAVRTDFRMRRSNNG